MVSDSLSSDALDPDLSRLDRRGNGNLVRGARQDGL